MADPIALKFFLGGLKRLQLFLEMLRKRLREADPSWGML